MKFIYKVITLGFFAICFIMQLLHAQVPQVIITSQVIGTVNPYLAQTISNNSISIRVTIQGISGSGATPVYAKLERLSPSPFTITLKEPSSVYRVPYGIIPRAIHNDTLAHMFGDFHPDKLSMSGISAADFVEGIYYKLPEGAYRLCFSTDPGFGIAQGCTTFNICRPAAPQFVQPVNNLNIGSVISKVQPTSPVVFTWIPPQSSCGVIRNLYNYDLEIREMFADQAVRDAINNPIVFRKTSLNASIFLLDTNLYKSVLLPGRKYVIRVKAKTLNNPPLVDTSIENNGYSRIEAFQYGDNPFAQNIMLPQQYLNQLYLPDYDEQLSNKLGDIFIAVKKHERADTTIALKNYIRLILMENNLAYNVDAIELFLSLNQDLINSKNVKLSYHATLPELPALSATSRESFNREYAQNVSPDPSEAKRFTRYMDTLSAMVKAHTAADSTTEMISTLLGKLNTYAREVDTLNRVSVKLANDLLSELLFELNAQQRPGRNRSGDITGLIAVIAAFTSPSSVPASSWHPLHPGRTSSLSAYEESVAGLYLRILSDFAQKMNGANGYEYAPPSSGRALPFNIVVYHYSKDDPSKTVLNAADLIATYRVFFVASGLLNHQNPEINAQSTTAPASTAQVTLPETKFMFWTQNMSNHKLTKAQEIDLMDTFLKSRKTSPSAARASIILKVD